MKTLKLASLMFVLAACASTPEPTPAPTAGPQPTATSNAAVDPIGVYEFATVVDGQNLTGKVHIEGSPAHYHGRIVTNVMPEIPVTSATVAGNVINVKGSLPDGDLIIRMVMDGMNFKGTWAVGSDSGEFNGKKLP